MLTIHVIIKDSWKNGIVLQKKKTSVICSVYIKIKTRWIKKCIGG